MNNFEETKREHAELSRIVANERAGLPSKPDESPKAPDWEGLKLALNNAIWMHAPGSTTLAQADEAACRAIGCLGECYTKATTQYGA